MIHEDIAVAAISKEGAAEFSNIRRCFHPARRFRIKISKFLPLSSVHAASFRYKSGYEVQTNLKTFLRSVEQGEEIEIRRRNKAVARLVPIEPKHGTSIAHREVVSDAKLSLSEAQ